MIISSHINLRLKALTWAILVAAPAFGAGTRIKEIVSLEGVRDNQLLGYGLVVGLNGTGDKRQTVFSAQALTNILQRMGVSVNPTAILVRNMAAVMVTATLPPFAQPGTKIDVTAAAIGDATNLQGGMLLLTPLNGADGKAYAAAQGNILTGGFAAGRGGNSQTVNHPTVGRIPAGAIVEQAPPSVTPGLAREQTRTEVASHRDRMAFFPVWPAAKAPPADTPLPIRARMVECLAPTEVRSEGVKHEKSEFGPGCIGGRGFHARLRCRGADHRAFHQEQH